MMIAPRNATPAPSDYWAREPDLGRYGTELRTRREQYENASQSVGLVDLWRRAGALYYGFDPDTSRTSAMPTIVGPQGERVNLRSNVMRALVKQQAVLVTGSRLAYACRPIAYDAAATETVTVATAWCDQILDDHAEGVMHDAVTYAQIYGEGWVSSLWDPMLGEVESVDPETGAQKRVGAYRASVHRPDEIIRDPDVLDGDHSWIGVLRQRNRWDLLAMLPQHSRAILNAKETRPNNVFRVGIGSDSMQGRSRSSGYSDTIIVMEVYHRPCPAMPQGRVTWLLEDTVIMDGPSLYRDVPVYSLIVDRPPGGAWGYGSAWDLMGLQQWRDSVLSQVVSTRENYGMKMIAVPPGSKLDPEVYGAFRVIETVAPPTTIDLEGNATEQGATAMQLITGDMQMSTGLNDAALGNAGKSTSGAALAMQSSLSQQFNGDLQRAYAGLFERVMSNAVYCLRAFSTAEHVVHVIGKNRQGVAKRFMAADLAAIDGVHAEVGNPAMRTTGMRIETANQLLTAKVLPNAEAYLEMVATGRTEPALEGPRVMESLIERENEMMLRGELPPVADEDNHAEHIRQHAFPCSDPSVRMDPMIMAVFTAHRNEHAQRWAQMTMDPLGVSTLAATGQQPSPAAAMIQQQQQAAMQMAAQQGAMQAAGPPQPGAGPNAQPGPLPTNPPVQGQQAAPTPGGPDMPQMPSNAPPMA